MWRNAVTAGFGLLLGSHVSHQVTDTVAVSELIVVPGRENKRLSSNLWKDIWLFTQPSMETYHVTSLTK